MQCLIFEWRVAGLFLDSVFLSKLKSSIRFFLKNLGYLCNSGGKTTCISGFYYGSNSLLTDINIPEAGVTATIFRYQ